MICNANNYWTSQAKKSQSNILESFLLITFALYLLSTGVKATYLLAVAFLEIIRFSCIGGILCIDSTMTMPKSAFSCVFEYLLTPNLMPAVFQCLTAIVYRAFETAVAWLVVSDPQRMHFLFGCNLGSCYILANNLLIIWNMYMFLCICLYTF